MIPFLKRLNTVKNNGNNNGYCNQVCSEIHYYLYCVSENTNITK